MQCATKSTEVKVRNTIHKYQKIKFSVQLDIWNILIMPVSNIVILKIVNLCTYICVCVCIHTYLHPSDSSGLWFQKE